MAKVRIRLDKLIVLFLKNTFLAFNRKVVSSLCAAPALIWWFVFKEILYRDDVARSIKYTNSNSLILTFSSHSGDEASLYL